MKVDYLVVGSGLTGVTVARSLADCHREVLVVDRRPHTGGNVHDHVHPSGIRIHTYGPHYFRTDSVGLWEYVNRFGEFYPFSARVQSLVDGVYENWPIAGSCVRRIAGKGWVPDFQGTPGNFEEASLSMMPLAIYERFVKGYTEKQWGVPARSLLAGLAGRFDLRDDDDPRLSRSRYQGLPAEGYAAWVQKMLTGIPVLLNYDYLHNRASIAARRMLVFTGPIDEFFDFRLGRLEYRAQIREHEYRPDIQQLQPCPVVNYPHAGQGPHVRTIEWKQMMPVQYGRRIQGTVLTTETAVTPNIPDRFEYPFPDAANWDLYQRYAKLAEALPGVLICGRLGDYRYYDMDQAIQRAQTLACRILDQPQAPLREAGS